MTKIILTLASLFCCTLVFAQPNDSVHMNHRLEEVVVTGTRTEKRLSESPVLTTLISERTIGRAAAVSTLESLQDNIPGIVITPNAMGNNMRIKGLNSRYILMLVDGERLVSEGAGGNVNLDQIDVASIKRIEMVDGAASALYGSNAVGAVINVITKDPVHNLEAGAGQSWESHNTLRSQIDVGSAFERFSVRAGGFRNASDGFGGDGEGAYAARYEDYGANLKWGFRPTERSEVNLTGRWFRHETFNPDGSMNVAHDMSQNLTVGAGGGWTTPNERNALRFSVNFDRYFDFDVLEKKNGEHRLSSMATYISSRAVNTFTPSDKWEIVGGLEHNHEENYAVKTLGTEPTTRRVDDANAFAQVQYKPLTNLDIIGGGRYTWNSAFGSAFTPKLSLMYSVSGFRFRGGVGTAFRAPSIKELYYDFDHQGMFWIYGNPDLKAERGLYTSFSVEYTRNSFNISAAGYYNRIDNKITLYDAINEQGGNEKYYKNVSHATLQGVDVNVAYTLARKLTFRGSYGFCDAVDDATKQQLESNVRHSGTASVTWNGQMLDTPFSLQLAGRMNSPILYYDGTVASQSKSYSIWKIAWVQPFTIARKHTLEVTFKIDNLFDFKESSFINPGRQYLAGLSYRFKTQLNNNH
jgi:outer membrane receptor for ferrienterochelin and colicins